jgi:hypothetical protein
MNIITNNVPRDIIYGFELTEKERKEFDYLDWRKIESGEESRDFFRYKGNVYDLSDCERSVFNDWSGLYSESFFSGVVFKFAGDNMDKVIVGRYYT